MISACLMPTWDRGPMTCEIVGLWSGYRDLVVLRDVNLIVNPGEVVALLGRNGVGKSTLVSSIAGLLPASQGSVRIDGAETIGTTPEAIARLGLSVMPQGHRVFGSLTVQENLELAFLGCGRRGWQFDRVVHALPILATRRSQVARTLSGGEQQMLMLGRMLAAAGKVCVLDEPTEGLAPAIVELFASVIQDLRGEGRATLLIEQQMDFAVALADRIAVMSRGAIVFDGGRQEFKTDEAVRREYLSF